MKIKFLLTLYTQNISFSLTGRNKKMKMKKKIIVSKWIVQLEILKANDLILILFLIIKTFYFIECSIVLIMKINLLLSVFRRVLIINKLSHISYDKSHNNSFIYNCLNKKIQENS